MDTVSDYAEIHAEGGLLVEAGDHFDFQCCDCGLVHTIDVRVWPAHAFGLSLEFNANRRATRAARRRHVLRTKLRALLARIL